MPHHLAQRLGIRLIAPDRPGFGQSDFKPGRTLLDWVADVAEIILTLETKDQPVFDWDLPDGDLKAQLIPNVEMRALLELNE